MMNNQLANLDPEGYQGLPPWVHLIRTAQLYSDLPDSEKQIYDREWSVMKPRTPKLLMNYVASEQQSPELHMLFQGKLGPSQLEKVVNAVSSTLFSSYTGQYYAVLRHYGYDSDKAWKSAVDKTFGLDIIASALPSEQEFARHPIYGMLLRQITQAMHGNISPR